MCFGGLLWAGIVTCASLESCLKLAASGLRVRAQSHLPSSALRVLTTIALCVRCRAQHQVRRCFVPVVPIFKSRVWGRMRLSTDGAANVASAEPWSVFVAPLSLAEIQTQAGDAVDTTIVYLRRRREIESRVLTMIKQEVPCTFHFVCFHLICSGVPPPPVLCHCCALACPCVRTGA